MQLPSAHSSFLDRKNVQRAKTGRKEDERETLVSACWPRFDPEVYHVWTCAFWIQNVDFLCVLLLANGQFKNPQILLFFKFCVFCILVASYYISINHEELRYNCMWLWKRAIFCFSCWSEKCSIFCIKLAVWFHLSADVISLIGVLEHELWWVPYEKLPLNWESTQVWRQASPSVQSARQQGK